MLEQSIDRLSTLIEQLIAQLEAGRTGKPVVSGKVQGTEIGRAAKTDSHAKAEEPELGKSSSGDTKSSASTAPSDSGKPAEKAGLDYFTDVAPRFSLLVAKDRAGAITLMRKRKADAKKLEEVVLVDGKHDQDLMAAVLTEINEALGG